MPSRRALLAAFATFSFSTAGCLGSSRSTELPVGESHDAGSFAVRVSNPRVRHGIAKFGTVHIDPVWEAGAQFLVVDLAVEGDGPTPSELDVVAETNQGSVEDRYPVHSPGATETIRSFGFPIPTDEGLTDVAVRWRGTQTVSWTLSDDIVASLRRAPDFTVESFVVPETAAPETDVDVSLTVQNTGDRDGRFLAELGPAGLSDQSEIEVRVPAGETKTTTRPVQVYFSDDDTADVVLRWEGGTEQRTVQRT
ncbi:hypothetical protein ACH9L7_10860 [Haloferax sp. S1W]|uniref:hypothetical protein n=1 Tax=Haloferax sp. S1W TaxID=3377110 RepID=UPI0037CA0848